MKSAKPQLALFITIAVFFLQACYCSSAIPNVVCVKADGTTYIYGMDDLWGRDECAGAGDTHAGTTYLNPTAVPPVLPPSGTNNIVAPSGLNCNFLELTSPLSGLPNGTATFYWNVLPGAVAYRINIYDHTNTFLASFDSQGGATNLSADVSWAAIGGQYDLLVELVAFGGGTSCRETVSIPREAPSGGFTGSGGGGSNGGNAVSAPTEVPLPDCKLEPWHNHCLR